MRSGGVFSERFDDVHKNDDIDGSNGAKTTTDTHMYSQGFMRVTAMEESGRKGNSPPHSPVLAFCSHSSMIRSRLAYRV